ncbi:MAG TPA: energy transducer TonB [Bryobacteraceae bacterium]|jgi:protein TonB
MFEQSLLTAGPATRKTGAVFASFSAQILGIGVLICVPLIYSDVLPQIKLSRPLAWRVSAPPPPDAVQQAQPTAAAPLQTPSAPTPFKMPARRQIFATIGASTLDIDAPTLPVGDGPVPIQSLPVTTLPAIEKPKPPVTATATVTKPPDHPLTVGGDVQAAKIIRRVLPAYPILAKQTRTSGTVHLSGIIAKDGTVQKLQVLGGPPLLVKAAVDAVSQWIYKPTILDGQPVEVIAPIDVIFTLQ